MPEERWLARRIHRQAIRKAQRGANDFPLSSLAFFTEGTELLQTADNIVQTLGALGLKAQVYVRQSFTGDGLHDTGRPRVVIATRNSEPTGARRKVNSDTSYAILSPQESIDL